MLKLKIPTLVEFKETIEIFLALAICSIKNLQLSVEKCNFLPSAQRTTPLIIDKINF